MRNVLCWVAGAVLLLGLGVLPAQGAEPKEGVSLTVYNQNFGVVKEVRRIAIGKGVAELKFRDVAKRIDPTSVHFKSLTDPEGTTVIEQNYEFDLVSADKLLDKYIDKKIGVVTKDGTRYEGTLLSFDGGQLVIDTGKGLAMVQRPNNVRNIEFSQLPGGLLTRPTLVWKVTAEKPGKHLTQVTYQTTGMGWRADYSVILNAKDTAMDLTGWVTLTNQCGAGFKDAKIKLIAGDVRRIVPQRRTMTRLHRAPATEKPRAAGFQEKSFFEYHMYTLGRPSTVNANQIKQIELLTASGVPVTKRYVFEPGGRYWHRRYGAGDLYKVNVYVEFTNNKASKLGMPLPKGKVRVYKRDDADGDLEFVGEDQIDHTPRDEKLKLYVGDAFDLVGSKKVTDRQKGPRWRREAVEIELRNHKDSDVSILVRERLGGGQWEVLAKSQPFEKIDASTIHFEVPVKANGKAKVTYTVNYRW